MGGRAGGGGEREAYALKPCPSPILSPVELELSKTPGAAATAVWLDPTGMHAVAAVVADGAGDVVYAHSSSKAVRSVAGLRGADVTAAAFDGGGGTLTSTGRVVGLFEEGR